MKITVHHFKWYDENKHTTFYPEVKRTMEWITRTQGADVIPGTAQIVDESELDAHGAFHPRGKDQQSA